MTAIPYLIVHDAIAAIDFYRHAFGATEFVRLATPDGKIMHAEIRIGEAKIMVATNKEDVLPAELQRRFAAMMQTMP
jgi:PhnB protein